MSFEPTDILDREGEVEEVGRDASIMRPTSCDLTPV